MSSSVVQQGKDADVQQFQNPNLNLGCIGNCNGSALIDKRGQIVWSCFPRMDGDPIFCSLIKRNKFPAPANTTRGEEANDIGFFDICVPNLEKTEQSYLRNTAVLSTKLYDKSGSAVEVVDFFPRFFNFDREFRPSMLIRVVTPIIGRPRIQVRLRPTFGYGWGTPERTRGTNHIRYLLSTMTIRLTTNAPISYVAEEVFFDVNEPIYLLLMPDESLKTSLEETTTTFLHKTVSYWKTWVKTLTIPFEWQDAVIRASITLKLNHFEETGAIVAAQTTSVPTSPFGGNYDLRYCWLRDSVGVVKVLNLLGSSATLASYLHFLSNIVADWLNGSKSLQPVYGISREPRLPEKQMHRLAGFRGQGPVIIGNKDYESIQNDVYGSVILALTQYFFDRRLEEQHTEILFKQLEELGEMAFANYDKPDAGPMNNRKSLPEIYTFSGVMCWVACDRLAKIASKLKNAEKWKYWRDNANLIQAAINEKGYNKEVNSFVSVWDGTTPDAFLLLMPWLGFISARDEKFMNTLSYIEKTLKKGNYIATTPETICSNSATFWYITVLTAVGRKGEARKLFEIMLATRNHLGILSETVDEEGLELWGNLPHSLATVSLVEAAIRLSTPWTDVF